MSLGKKYGIDEWGTRYHRPPVHWGQKTPTGKQRKFVSDGFLPVGKGIIVEQKHSDKHGTTEEKVFYALGKVPFICARKPAQKSSTYARQKSSPYTGTEK